MQKSNFELSSKKSLKAEAEETPAEEEPAADETPAEEEPTAEEEPAAEAEKKLQ